MAGLARRCGNCGKPLRVTARADARYCDRACKAAARRRRQHDLEALDIIVTLKAGQHSELVVTCPVCGRRFALGHGHRRDAVYDRPACRQAAYRARHADDQANGQAERVRQAVTPGPGHDRDGRNGSAYPFHLTTPGGHHVSDRARRPPTRAPTWFSRVLRVAYARAREGGRLLSPRPPSHPLL